jgi:cold shock CspA family protein
MPFGTVRLLNPNDGSGLVAPEGGGTAGALVHPTAVGSGMIPPAEGRKATFGSGRNRRIGTAAATDLLPA